MDIYRLSESINKLGHIGYVEGRGTSRMAYSDAFYKGRDYVKSLMEEAGLTTHIDAVGNLTGVLEGSEPKKIAIGSHIDTVPNGGMYDGALGVLAGIEAVRSLKEMNYQNRYTIEIIAFNEEEGNVVGGTFGSKAFAGAKLEDSMIEKMAQYNMTISDFKSAKRNGKDYLAYLEYHIEQGGILEKINTEIGIVPGIFGIIRYRVVVNGVANHAGSTPMYLRNDALEKSCNFITDSYNMARKKNNTMVCTIGVMNIEPGAVNVIPGRAEFVIELRDKDMTDMYEVINELQEKYAGDSIEMTKIIEQENTVCSPELISLLKECAEDLGYSSATVYSGAGHDLINTSMIMPSALLFIPSVKGISHHKDEFSKNEHIEKGTKVLIEAIKRIDGGDYDEN
ncbi:MAG: M20 family metallo-hydrolase [Firmicutes bacterium]|nr:M20 family metallo-hydrolase [Bacillota bacterium]